MAVVANAGGAWYIVALCGLIWSLRVCISIIWLSFTSQKKYNSWFYLSLISFLVVICFFELLAIGLEFSTDYSAILACKLTFTCASVRFVV